MTATSSRRTDPQTNPGSPVTTYYLLTVASALLVVVGLAVVLSSTSSAALRQSQDNPYSIFLVQVAALVLGVIAMVVGSRMPVMFWKRVAPWALYSSIGLLIVVATSGITSGGNRNWIPIGQVTFQPSEVAKLGLALSLGVVLGRFRNQLTTFQRILVPGGLMVAAVLGLVLLGQDLGTALVVGLVAVACFWVAGMPLRFFVPVGLIGAAGIAFMLTQGTTRSARIDVWLNPENCDIQDTCAQSIHGQWALASGGLWGLGPGMSREKWGYLPVADSDFIFAIVGEEYGLVGTLLMLVAFGMIAVAINRLVHRHTDPFVQIAAAGIGAWIVGQACINIAVVVGLAPITGVPLPLVSSGGSSLIASLAAIGVLMAFARREPGAQEAFAARPSVVKRSIAVMARGRRG